MKLALSLINPDDTIEHEFIVNFATKKESLFSFNKYVRLLGEAYKVKKDYVIYIVKKKNMGTAYPTERVIYLVRKKDQELKLTSGEVVQVINITNTKFEVMNFAISIVDSYGKK